MALNRFLALHPINFSIGKSGPSQNWPYNQFGLTSEGHTCDTYCTYFNAILLYVLGVVSDESFSTVKFPSSTSTHDIKDKYIYAAFNSITYDKESCASLCYTHTISSTACQFFIFYSDTCMLGNFQSTDTYTSPQDSFTAYFNESEYTKLKKLNFQNIQGRWILQQQISVHTHAMRA